MRPSKTLAGLRSGIRFFGTLSAVLGVLLGLPALLAAAAVQRFDHVSPLHGVQAPWRWSIKEMRSWGRRLSRGSRFVGSTRRHLLPRCVGRRMDLCCRLDLHRGRRNGVPASPWNAVVAAPSSRWARFARLVGTKAGNDPGRRAAARRQRFADVGGVSRPSCRDRRPSSNVLRICPNRPLQLFTMPIPDEATSTSALGDGWSVVEVKRGDSVWGIAQRIADGGNVAAIAEQIVGANLGTVMSDGHRFSTPALIEPGWLLNVPSAGPAVPIIDGPDERAVNERKLRRRCRRFVLGNRREPSRSIARPMARSRRTPES